MAQMKSFMSSLISIQEKKVSTLLCLLVVGFIYALYQYQINGDITSSLVDLLSGIIYSIAGINIADSAANMFGKRNRNSYVNTNYDQIEDNYDYEDNSNSPTI